MKNSDVTEATPAQTCHQQRSEVPTAKAAQINGSVEQNQCTPGALSTIQTLSVSSPPRPARRRHASAAAEAPTGPLLTPTEAMSQLKIGRTKFYELIKRGLLRRAGNSLGRVTRVHLEDVERLK